MYIYVESLEWDSKNIEHIARHKVTPDEVEEICQELHVARRKDGRLFLIGPTLSSRMLVVILVPLKKKRHYRPITAWPAKKLDIEYYDNESR